MFFAFAIVAGKKIESKFTFYGQPTTIEHSPSDTGVGQYNILSGDTQLIDFLMGDTGDQYVILSGDTVNVNNVMTNDDYFTLSGDFTTIDVGVSD